MREVRKDNFKFLLAALILFLVGMAAVDSWDNAPANIASPILFTLVLSIGVWSLKRSVRVFRIAMVLVAVGIVFNILSAAMTSATYDYLATLTMFVFLVIATWSAFRQILFSDEVNANRIYGAICVYLLLGITWALAYSSIFLIDAESFSGAISLTAQGSGQWVYYSFVTLTTLGYGDILPVSPLARALAYLEAIFGVFYMAILVAMLVSAYASKKMDRSG